MNEGVRETAYKRGRQMKPLALCEVHSRGEPHALIRRRGRELNRKRRGKRRNHRVGCGEVGGYRCGQAKRVKIEIGESPARLGHDQRRLQGVKDGASRIIDHIPRLLVVRG